MSAFSALEKLRMYSYQMHVLLKRGEKREGTLVSILLKIGTIECTYEMLKETSIFNMLYPLRKIEGMAGDIIRTLLAKWYPVVDARRNVVQSDQNAQLNLRASISSVNSCEPADQKRSGVKRQAEELTDAEPKAKRVFTEKPITENTTQTPLRLKADLNNNVEKQCQKMKEHTLESHLKQQCLPIQIQKPDRSRSPMQLDSSELVTVVPLTSTETDLVTSVRKTSCHLKIEKHAINECSSIRGQSSETLVNEISACSQDDRVCALEQNSEVLRDLADICSLIQLKRSFKKPSNVSRVFDAKNSECLQLCQSFLIENADHLGHLGPLPFDVLLPVLKSFSPLQVQKFEYYNQFWVHSNKDLWNRHFNPEVKIVFNEQKSKRHVTETQ